MRNMMNRENTMRSCRNAMTALAGVDNRTMREIMTMSMVSAGTAADLQEDVMNSLFCERSAAAADFNY